MKNSDIVYLKYFALLGSLLALTVISYCFSLHLPFWDNYHCRKVDRFLNLWEGELLLGPNKNTVSLSPKRKDTSLLLLYIHGNVKGKAEIEVFPYDARIALDKNMNNIFRFDWYNGECTLKYISDNDSDSIWLMWRFI